MGAYESDPFEDQGQESSTYANCESAAEDGREKDSAQNNSEGASPRIVQVDRVTTGLASRNSNGAVNSDQSDVVPKESITNSSRYKKNVLVPQIVLVDISRPIRAKYGEGDPVEDPVFANLSFPVSMSLPGIGKGDLDASGPQLDNIRWSFFEGIEPIGELDLASLLRNDLHLYLDLPDWFRAHEVSKVEQDFLNTSIPECENYLYIRNIIIRSYLELPQIFLTVSTVASRLFPYSIFHISQIHAFIQDWGMINTKICTGPYTCLSSRCVGLLRKQLLKLKRQQNSGVHENGNVTPDEKYDETLLVYESCLEASLRAPSYMFQSQRLAERDKIAKLRLEEHTSVDDTSQDEGVVMSDIDGPKCFLCLKDCVFVAYRHINLPLMICPSCFKDGLFAMDTPSSSFVCLRIAPPSDLMDQNPDTKIISRSSDNCDSLNGNWNEEAVLQLLCYLEKEENLDWVKASKLLNSLNPSSSKMDLRKTSPPPQENRLRACRKHLKKKSQKTHDAFNPPTKKQRITEFDPVFCVQKFLSLHHSDFVFNDPIAKKSLLESSQNIVMTLLSTIHRTLGGGIAAAGAIRCLEFLSEYVNLKLEEIGRGHSSTTSHYSATEPPPDILKFPPDETLINSLAVEVLKGSAEEARRIAKWEDVAAELLVQQIIDLECKKVSCKIKLIKLLDQG